jgi:4-hydroxy-3-polyprenylbenzoate decarboxylase
MPKVPLNIYQTPDEKGDAQTGTSKAKTAKAYIDATRDPVGGDNSLELTRGARARAQSVLAAAGMPTDRLTLADAAEEVR